MPGALCAPGRAVLPEWSCLEDAHLVQDQEAKSQEGGELPEAHDASAREESRYHRPSSEFCEPTHLDSGLLSAGNSLAPWLQAAHFISPHCFVFCFFHISEVACWKIQ